MAVRQIAAEKIYDTVSSVIEKQLLSDATAGDVGSDGIEAANWVSLVRK